MQRNTTYVLTVHYYPFAAAANVTPVEVQAYTLTELPGRYRTHEFTFQHPPTADDFKAVVKQLPWAQHAWGADLLPILDNNQWPYIGMGKKAASTDLTVQDYGVTKKVGHLEVRKNEVWQNEEYPTNIYVPHDLRNILTRGYKGQAREEVREYIDRNELRIIGNVVKWSKDNGGVWPGQDQIADEVRKIITEWKAQRQPQPA